MHLLVFEDGDGRLIVILDRRRLAESALEDLVGFRAVLLHTSARRPLIRRRLRRIDTLWIDASLEENLIACVDSRLAQRELDQRVDRERR